MLAKRGLRSVAMDCEMGIRAMSERMRDEKIQMCQSAVLTRAERVTSYDTERARFD